MTNGGTTVDIGERLARQRFSRRHFVCLTFCFLVLFIDGLDSTPAEPAVLGHKIASGAT